MVALEQERSLGQLKILIRSDLDGGAKRNETLEKYEYDQKNDQNGCSFAGDLVGCNLRHRKTSERFSEPDFARGFEGR